MDNAEFSQKLQERLIVYSASVANFCRTLTKDRINLEYIDQLNRSSSSIGANYLEAIEGESKKDFLHRIKICRKESRESKYWLELITRLNPDKIADAKELLSETEEFIRLFSSIVNRLINSQLN